MSDIKKEFLEKYQLTTETLKDLRDDFLNLFDDYMAFVEENKQLDAENTNLLDKANRLKLSVFELPDHHENLRMSMAMEKIFDNLDRIPMEELENFGNKYSVV